MMATQKASDAVTSETFMTLLKRHRMSRGLSQTQLAKKLGLVPSNVSMWESGDKWPAPRHIPKLARFLGLKPLELVEILDAASRRSGPRVAVAK